MEELINIMQNEIIEQMEELERKNREKEIYTIEYTPQRDILNAKLDMLLEVERRVIEEL
jgi:hypothetical protein